MKPRRNMVDVRLERSCGASIGGNVLPNAVAESIGGESECGWHQRQRRRAAGSGHAAEAAHLTNPPHGGLPPA